MENGECSSNAGQQDQATPTQGEKRGGGLDHGIGGRPVMSSRTEGAAGQCEDQSATTMERETVPNAAVGSSQADSLIERFESDLLAHTGSQSNNMATDGRAIEGDTTGAAKMNPANKPEGDSGSPAKPALGEKGYTVRRPAVQKAGVY
ncbi:hypothetical protein K431DRAFT_45061 [Polychaeton citri CBS 116435]|uniref:Uncharacterized protein n=1 Tax=Polychaeton citri CBS 116435 TaxID=1314669 RepID=A0A9P4URY5_9PEZI|nr:hypothetical protein K431DRAFT_45061 [Polychaeton citri CBS 116435]